MFRTRRRCLVLLSVVLLVAGLGVPAASAAGPRGDRIADARVISDVPTRLVVDTSRATTTPATDVGGYPCMGGRSVWFRVAPTVTGTVRAVTRGSDFDTLLGVFTGTPQRLTPLTCSDDTAVGAAVELELQAGTTYWIALSSCCDPTSTAGGRGVLQLYRPQPLGVRTVVSDTAAGDVSGRALLSGTVRCTNPASSFLEVTVSQRLGAFVARGSGLVSADCGRGRTAWSVSVDSRSGRAFRSGPAVVTVSTFLSDGFRFVETTHEAVVTLRLAPNAVAASASG